MSNDCGWLRWNRLRWRFVEALEHSAFHDPSGPMVSCELDECCRELSELSTVFAIRLGSEDRRHTHMDYADSGYSETGAMRDGMIMLTDLYSTRSLATATPLAGYKEVPEHVGKIIVSGHFRNLDGLQPRYPGEDPFDNCREFVYALAELAFPDEYLAHLHGSPEDDGDLDDEDDTTSPDASVPRVLHGSDAYGDLRYRFESAGYVAPLLCSAVIEHLTVETDTMDTSTPHFGFPDDERGGTTRRAVTPIWEPGAPYELAWGVRDAGLKNYWEGLASLPWAFSYFERGNGYGTGMCFIVRSPGIFVAQQVWDSGLSTEPSTEPAARAWDRCTAAYNTHLVPLLDTAGAAGAAMVVFSDFRNDAYIVSDDPRSWDDYAQQSWVLRPLPDGWGITGVWRGHDEQRYIPPSLDQIIRAGYSDQITACAKYLKECLNQPE